MLIKVKIYLDIEKTTINMTADLTSTTTLNFLSILTQTAIAYREGNKPPVAEIVVNALLAAEKSAKQQRLN
ncbi:MAG: hypothetical protein ACKO2Z_18470, partial [Sphaerospermopsis kisseleviana]